MRFNAYILAGGKSSRMGRDKALLELGGERLIERALRQASAVADRVALVGNHPWLTQYGRVVRDIHAGAGPLAAIHAALADSDTEWNLMLAVDQISAPSELLHLLAARAAAAPAGCAVVAPQIAARIQPLCALYRRSFLALTEAALARDQRRLTDLFPAANALVIPEAELLSCGIDTRSLYNVNTPEELDQARRSLSIDESA
jgi:molybdopterin-guanine dinucleotide biosynthesis protein A